MIYVPHIPQNEGHLRENWVHTNNVSNVPENWAQTNYVPKVPKNWAQTQKHGEINEKHGEIDISMVK